MDLKNLYDENKKNIIILVGIILILIIFMVIFSGTKKEQNNNEKVSNIIFSEEEIMIEENRTYQIRYEIYPSGLEDVKLSWSSIDENIATVDENGLITAIRPGTTEIKAKANNKAVDNLIIKVVEERKDATSIKFNIENFDLKINTYRRLLVMFEPEEPNYETIEWSSSNESVATVSSIGRVNGVKTGKAVITATVKLKNGSYLSASSNVNVTKETTLSLADSSQTTLNEDTTKELTLTLSDSNVVIKDATYKVSNENIVQVIKRPSPNNSDASITSIIRGIGKGKATITYTVETTDGEIISLTTNINVK